MKQNNPSNEYRPDIFKEENIVGFASKQTMYQPHALYFKSEAGAGVMIPDKNEGLTPGRQVLTDQEFNERTKSEGSNYTTYNQSYQRYLKDFFTEQINKNSRSVQENEALSQPKAPPLSQVPSSEEVAASGERPALQSFESDMALLKGKGSDTGAAKLKPVPEEIFVDFSADGTVTNRDLSKLKSPLLFQTPTANQTEGISDISTAKAEDVTRARLSNLERDFSTLAVISEEDYKEEHKKPARPKKASKPEERHKLNKDFSLTNIDKLGFVPAAAFEPLRKKEGEESKGQGQKAAAKSDTEARQNTKQDKNTKKKRGFFKRR